MLYVHNDDNARKTTMRYNVVLFSGDNAIIIIILLLQFIIDGTDSRGRDALLRIATIHVGIYALKTTGSSS